MSGSSARVAPVGDGARQFLVTTAPPNQPNGGTQLLPFCLWIEKTETREAACGVCHTVFVATPESTKEWERVSGVRSRSATIYVCDCMGHFIE